MVPHDDGGDVKEGQEEVVGESPPIDDYVGEQEEYPHQ